jgi:hypothetical protein
MLSLPKPLSHQLLTHLAKMRDAPDFNTLVTGLETLARAGTKNKWIATVKNPKKCRLPVAK